MIELAEEEQKSVRAFLVACAESADGGGELCELEGLVKTLGYECSGTHVLLRREPQPKFGMGSGRAQSICDSARRAESDCIIFDFEISPTHQRNWEKLCAMPVFDRQEVILRIFAQRAKTKEAALQVELAQLQYSLPRLAHSYGDMARQRGGSYGAKGSGETKLELDRRAVQARISRIRAELAKVVKERDTLRKQRAKMPLPSCALVGYTNAGKSSLLNALTSSDVFVEDKLFATLDPTTRRLELAGGGGMLLTDTVGFISNLPHSLVNAFKSTLEEAARADLLLLVLDSSDPAARMHYRTVVGVLKEIGAEGVPVLVALNKTDAAEPFALELLRREFGGAVCISAKNKTGFGELIERLSQMLLGCECTYRVPLEQRELLQLVRKNGAIRSELWRETHIELVARASGKAAALLAPYKAATE